MEDSGTGGTDVQSVAPQGFVEGPRPAIYHQQRDGELRAALLQTLMSGTAIKFPIEGLSRGRIQSTKNRCYRAGKRLQESHPGVTLRTRISEGYLCAWLEQ
jgi:hypothetical protein